MAAFAAVPQRTYVPEPERLRRLAAQVEQKLLPPASIAHLFDEEFRIPEWRQQEALTAWLSARKRTSEHAPDAAEELAFLNVILGNQFLHSGDWTKHRALLESALEAFFLPRHQSVVASELCLGACRQGDTQGAASWLELVDPASDDLEADSSYRLAYAGVAFARHDYQSALNVLGPSGAAVPVHDSRDCTLGLHRAHALERLGYVDAAVTELVQVSSKSTTNKTLVAKLATATRMAPQASARAQVVLAQQSNNSSGSAGAALLFALALLVFFAILGVVFWQLG